MITEKQYQELVTTRDTLKRMNFPVPEEVTVQIAEYESARQQGTDTPIYSKLKSEAKYPLTAAKEACIEETVEALLSDAPNASDPGLLLGKIQCGKTDTFENIIGLAFDKGIDIAIVLTKGTKALVNQTIQRMRNDYRFFQESDDLEPAATIVIEDIMDNRTGFNQARIERAKTVIVAKKETNNLQHLIKIFNHQCPWMRDKKVLIVDDEADFASRNYQKVKLQSETDEYGDLKIQDSKLKMARISELIDELRQLPRYCRYLQVTATPYCLFLQPDGNIDVDGGQAMPFRPRFTKLVPEHKSYIGGKQYFVESIEDSSMFSHLYRSVSQKCIDVLGHVDRRYLRSGIASGNILGLTYALMSYLMATAVRRIQRRAEGKDYKSSAVIHVNVDQDNHAWQNELIKFMLSQIEAYFTGNSQDDQRLDFMIDEIHQDFKASSEKARTTGKKNEDGTVTTISVEYPALDEIKREVAKIFEDGAINQKVVNSKNDMPALLDRNNGQLRLDSAVNIFIGGSILDRGITINNMLCFFYGRDPRTFQQDTVLQHARFYGARSLEDMAVTRLHTTDNIYRALVRMNELDDRLREWFIKGLDQRDPQVTFVGYDKDIRPCAPSKIKPSKALTITQQKTFVPKGMKTGKAKEISNTVSEIEAMISSCPGYSSKDADGFFEMDAETAMDIIRLIQTTYRYDAENESEKNDLPELLAALHYCSQKAGGKILALHRTDRNLNRIRENGGWIDAPADGRTDMAPARLKAIDAPVLMLFRENGQKSVRQIGLKSDGTPETMNFGWFGTPFYWPVLLTQERIDPVLFATGQKDAGQQVTVDLDSMLDGIGDGDVLKLSYSGSLLETFGEPGDQYQPDDCPVDTRSVRDTNWTRFLVQDSEGEPELIPGMEMDDKWAGVFTFNKGKFPFVLKPYKYMLLYTGRGKTAMLLELFPVKDWTVFNHSETDENGNLFDYLNPDVKLITTTDTWIAKNRDEKEVTNKELCQWVIDYPVRKVLKYQEFNVSQKGRD